MTEGERDEKEKDVDEASKDIDDILNGDDFKDLAAKIREGQDLAIDTLEEKVWKDIQNQLDAKYKKLGVEYADLNKLDHPDSTLKGDHFKQFLIERATAMYWTPDTTLSEFNKTISDGTQTYLSQNTTNINVRNVLGVPDGGVKIGDSDGSLNNREFNIMFARPWDDVDEQNKIKINGKSFSDVRKEAFRVPTSPDAQEFYNYLLDQENNVRMSADKLCENGFSSSNTSSVDTEKADAKTTVQFAVRHRIEKMKAAATAKAGADFTPPDGTPEPDSKTKTAAAAAAAKAESAERAAASATTEDELNQAHEDGVEAEREIRRIVAEEMDKKDKKDKKWSKWNFAFLLGFAAFTYYIAKKLADENSGCYMRISDAYKPVIKSKECCASCMQLESTGWVQGSVLLRNCKMGKWDWYNIPGLEAFHRHYVRHSWRQA